MFQLDDSFLQSLGISDLPEDQKNEFLQHIYQELELRVGEKLAQGMSEEQMAEFESILDRDESKVRGWLETNVPDYEQQEDYQNMVRALQDTGKEITIDALADYTATKWLAINRPNYREVVAQTLEELKNEIIQNRDAILAEG